MVNWKGENLSQMINTVEKSRHFTAPETTGKVCPMQNRKTPNTQAAWQKAAQQLKGVDALFDVLEKDKRLPSFPEFFMTCLIMGNAECVNLKTMFPKLYSDLSAWLTARQ